MNVVEELNSLTPAQAEYCLNIVLKGLAESSLKYQELVAADASLPNALDRVIQECKLQPVPVAEPPANTAQRTAAIKEVLLGLARDERFAEQVEAAVPLARRPGLPAALLTSLVVAGIILLLSTDIDFEHEVKNGKRETKIHIHKKPSASGILSGFMALLKG
jgi:hypothetical protein